MLWRTKQKKERVFVGLSGGVDSSVAAKRLIDAGHDVVGVFIKTWQPDFLPCNWEAERLDAMRVAAHLGIPFVTCDAVDAYRDAVAQYMIDGYKAGLTPNPDVMCNQHVKFGVFLEYARAHGATKVATGHYARVREKDGRYELLRGVDSAKDQSYFLWTLTQDQLAMTLFPVGDTPKAHIRAEAHRAGLATSKKEDSQGICFLGEVDMQEFLSHYIPAVAGEVRDTEGNVVGAHRGAFFYTVGQRHGFSITSTDAMRAPHYVVAKDVDTNTLTVDVRPPVVRDNLLTLASCNLAPAIPSTCEAQFRYRQKPFSVALTRTGDSTAEVQVRTPDIELPSAGQSCVLYDDEVCLGGGMIQAIT